MKNQVIKCLTPEHGKKILEYWKSKGVDTSDKTGTSCESDNHPWIYYGVISGRFENYSYNDVKFSNAEIIELPEDEPKQVICRDKLDRVIQNGYYVDVQDSGIHKVYRKEDGQLYFKPYGEEERVSSYFSNDLILMSYGSKLIMGLKKEIADKKQEESKQETLEEIVMETQKLSRQGLKEIHSVACSAWKSTLEEWGNTNPLEDYIELTQSQVTTIFLACTKEQLPIVSKYLKQDDGSVDLTKVTGGGFRDENDSPLIGKRLNGTYGNKAFWLHYEYDWEIKHDGYNICLIPTKKK
jgi:hypothetical protein